MYAYPLLLSVGDIILSIVHVCLSIAALCGRYNSYLLYMYAYPLLLSVGDIILSIVHVCLSIAALCGRYNPIYCTCMPIHCISTHTSSLVYQATTWLQFEGFYLTLHHFWGEPPVNLPAVDSSIWLNLYRAEFYLVHVCLSIAALCGRYNLYWSVEAFIPLFFHQVFQVYGCFRLCNTGPGLVQESFKLINISFMYDHWP